MSSLDATSAFIARHRELLKKEREEEIKRSHLLLSNCSQRQLEQKGLSITSLTISAINIGLGGNYLVELERPSAYHSSPLFPPHTLRSGDLARILPHAIGSGSGKKTTKGKKEETDSENDGVVYKVSDTRIIIALDRSDSGGTPEFPDRCTVVKVANSVTYDRMEKTLDDLEKAAVGSYLPVQLISLGSKYA
jgi:DNA polymerase alpha-associated DNA helicase A